MCYTVNSTFLFICICRRRQRHPTPVLLPGKSHGWRSLDRLQSMGSLSQIWQRLHFHFSLSCIGEGNGNPLQCSCLENPRDGGALWAAVYGITQSQTRLKWLSSSSSSITDFTWICTLFYILQNAFTFFSLFDLTYLNKAASNELPFGNVFWDFSFKQNNYLSVSGVSCSVACGILVP